MTWAGAAGRADDAVIADKHEKGVVEIPFLARLLHELADTPVQVSETAVLIKGNKPAPPVLRRRCAWARMPQVFFRNGIRPRLLLVWM